MNQQDYANPYSMESMPVAQASVDERTTFIRKTYIHLAAAAYCFVLLCFLFQKIIPKETLESIFLSKWGWLALMGGFMVASWVADRWARSNTSIGMQYAGLCLLVFAWSAIFTPLLYIANFYSLKTKMFGEVGVIPAAAVLTLSIFGVLTALVFLTKKDFSFMATGLRLAGIVAFGLIIFSMLTGFSLGVWFMGAMVVMASCYILYDTSNVLHHYHSSQHVAAAMALFASLGLLLWYVIQILLSFASSD